MRYKILILKIFILAFVITSCKKNLIEEPVSTLSPENVYTTEDGVKKATFGVYASWTQTFLVSSAPYDNIFDIYYRFVLGEAGNRYSAPGQAGAAFQDPYYRFAATPTDGGGATVWKRYYLTIARANSVIVNANKAFSDATKANVYIAEAKFLRAYAYFNLVRSFGGVPLMKDEITSLSQSNQIFSSKASIEETYSFIIEDMLYAEQNLPDQWTGENLGRVSKAAVKGMLGKVYLTMAGKPLSKPEYFQKAVDKLTEVGPTAEATYNLALLDDFKSVFSTSNKRNKEILLSFGYFFSSYSPNANLLSFFFQPDGLADGSQPNFGLTYQFFQLYGNTDVRRDFTVPDRYKHVGTGDSIVYDAVARQWNNKNTKMKFGGANTSGLGLGKMDRIPRPAGAVPWAASDDLIELRYSDVLLCLAEALTETGKTADALLLLNRIRARAKATAYTLTDQDDLRQKIRKERKLELTGEMHTIFDIRRWGTLQAEIAAMNPSQIENNGLNPYSAKLELYPIPQSQIDANPSLVQNTGW